MRDLFDASPISGLELREEVVTPHEEMALVERCAGLGLTPFQFQGWEGKRLTRSFGWHYDFAAGTIAAADPIPGWLSAVRDSAANAFGRVPARFEQALVIRYDPGAGIGWHRDRPQFDEVIGVSLGAPVTMAFRRRRADGKFDRVKLPLVPRSAYLLSGEVRSGWQHGIAAHDALRFSLTFRSLR
ncbi:alpha-ketoglutarate-dependent dioxygenase AlkB [Sphingomonas mesophila]|uniref:alpha-ketoglutarate-dependent dioxygenase AlkB n=1 Tax=Sphingomonas mesophila TaxID=2303576 RepID=UPI000E56953F|nr:alpha-ketoglutarate-dependent dioxygenase AlkB [Sphingomonas mesophila]